MKKRKNTENVSGSSSASPLVWGGGHEDEPIGLLAIMPLADISAAL
jgi:hypothetical protein